MREPGEPTRCWCGRSRRSSRATLDRIYRLLGLIYPWKDIAAARWTIEHATPARVRARSNTWTTCSAATIRKRVMPLLDDVPIDQKVRHANLFLKTRARDLEDTLAQLVHDDDQVVAAAAMHFVEERRDVGAHRRPRVRAGAPRRRATGMSSRPRRGRWPPGGWPPTSAAHCWMEPLPAVELADRLRHIPLFDFVSVDELFRIAGTGRQVRHEDGRVLYERAPRPTTCSSCSKARCTGRRRWRRACGRKSRRAGRTRLRGDDRRRPVDRTVTAVDRAICLTLRNEQVLALLAENADLVHGFFRMAIERDTGSAWRGVLRGVVAHPEVARLEDGLQPVEKILLMEEIPVFARASAADITALARAARETTPDGGRDARRRGRRARDLRDRERRARPRAALRGEPLSAGPGDTLGVYDTLSGAETTAWRVHVTRGGLALRVDREVLFDVLADRIELLQAMFSAVLRRQSAVPV